MSETTVNIGGELLQQYSQWLSEHMDELIAQYPGKIVAIENGKVVAVGTTYQEVYAPFERMERDWLPLVVEVPHPDELQEYLL